MATSLYLDTARLGQMSRGAQLALIDFTRLAGEQAGSLYFDDFLRHGWPAWPDSLRRCYRRLAAWQGVGNLKQDLKCLAAAAEDSRLLIANRTSQLMRFAARLFFGPCRNVLVTDLCWPSYARILQKQAEKSGNTVTQVSLRTAVLRGGLTAREVIDCLAAEFATRHCDGLFLPAVDNLGIRLPIEELVGEIRRSAELRFVVIDGAQSFRHFPSNLAGDYCDFFIAGCHKWLRAYHPMGLGFYGHPRSQHYIEAALHRFMQSGVLDDPLLQFSLELENGSTYPFGETVSLVSLFSCQGAVADVLASGTDLDAELSTRLANAEALIQGLSATDWNVVRPHPELSSGIVLLQSQHAHLRELKPDALRRRLLHSGVAATTYPDGMVRLSMPSRPWQPVEMARLHSALGMAPAIPSARRPASI